MKYHVNLNATTTAKDHTALVRKIAAIVETIERDHAVAVHTLHTSKAEDASADASTGAQGPSPLDGGRAWKAEDAVAAAPAAAPAKKAPVTKKTIITVTAKAGGLPAISVHPPEAPAAAKAEPEEPPAAAAKAEKQNTETPSADLDDLRQLIAKVSRAKGIPVAKQILGRFGATNASTVKPENIAACIQALGEAL